MLPAKILRDAGILGLIRVNQACERSREALPSLILGSVWEGPAPVLARPGEHTVRLPGLALSLVGGVYTDASSHCESWRLRLFLSHLRWLRASGISSTSLWGSGSAAATSWCCCGSWDLRKVHRSGPDFRSLSRGCFHSPSGKLKARLFHLKGLFVAVSPISQRGLEAASPGAEASSCCTQGRG